jgi:hypothetical protein
MFMQTGSWHCDFELHTQVSRFSPLSLLYRAFSADLITDLSVHLGYNTANLVQRFDGIGKCFEDVRRDGIEYISFL